MSISRVWPVFVLALALSRGCWAAATEKTVYGGQPICEAGIALSPWGSGSVVESTDKTLLGSKSIKIVTEGWFAGGSIDFKTPVELFSGKQDPGDFLVLSVAPTPVPVTEDAADGYSTEDTMKPKIQKLRVVLISDKGKRQEMIQPLVSSSETMWWKVGVPLAKIKSLADISQYNLKRLLIFSDVADTIYIGAIKVARDTESLNAEPGGDVSYTVGDCISFRANATGGLSAIRCSWDFDSKDGIQEDAVGGTAAHTYKTGGDYVVTLTVSDLNGLKPTCVKTIKARID